MSKKGIALSLYVFILLSLILAGHVAASDGPVTSDKAAGFAVEDSGNTDSGSGTTVPDLFKGQMRYSIPIDVVPGRKGMQPNLGLTYRSNSGNGWLGVGWDLEVGAIERSIKKGVAFDGDDYILRMDGAAIDLIYDSAVGFYHTKIEGKFYKIQKILSGQVFYWQLTDKTGRKHLFGQTAASRQYDPADENKIFKWCLDRVEDTNGNYMDFTYDQHPPDGNTPYEGQLYLKQIAYTGNSLTGALPTNQIHFYLEERTDAPEIYTTYFLVTTRYRLKTIDIIGDGNHARTYSLRYDTDLNTDGDQYSPMTGRSLLTSVQQFDKDAAVDANGTVTGGSSLPPILLSYQFDTPEFVDAGTWRDNWCIGQATWMKTLDFNGDGKSDMYCHDWNADTTAVSLSNGVDAFTDISSNMTNACAEGWRQIGTGHFNTDVQEDFYCYWPATGTANVALSLGDDFGPDNQWVSQWAVDKWPEVGDFNGDGQTDLVTWEKAVYTSPYYGPATGQTYVALSNGVDGFTVGANDGLWLDNWCTGSYGRLIRGDFNGDGKTDLFCHNLSGFYVPSSGENKVALSNGVDGFTLGANSGLWLDNWCNTGYPDNATIIPGDFNGDGNTDLICRYNYTGKTHVALSNGVDGFTVGADAGLWRDNWCAWSNISVGDFNEDGMTDIYCSPTQNTGKIYVALSNGKDAFTVDANDGLWLDNWCGAAGHWTWTGDFNGDSKTDLLCTVPNTGGNVYIALSGTSKVRNDLLSSVSNGLGGSTSITYKPSTEYNNTQLPFPVQTVSSVTTCDNYDSTTSSCAGVSATTSYEYSGGFFHIGEKDFRGFNRVTATMNANGPSSEQKVVKTWFHQGNDTGMIPENITLDDLRNLSNVTTGYMKGRPYRSRTTDGSSNVYSETTTSYRSIASANGGYFYAPDTATTYICGSSATSCTSATSGQSKVTKYAYDGYGNMIQEEVYDSAVAAAPYRTTQRTFTVENTSNYLVGYSKFETVYDGPALSGNEVSSTIFYYDAVSSCESLSRSKEQLPTKGNVTTIVRWFKEKSASAADPESNMSYDDGYGNLNCTRDPKGNVSRIVYDTDTNTYPTRVTNAKEQPTDTRYYGVDGVSTVDGLYGKIESVTDPNGAETKTEYDTFGRVVKIEDPYGTTATYGTKSISYENWGAVGLQKVVTYNTVDYATSSFIWSETYFDGFGRTIRMRAQGPDNKVIAADTVYNNRGAIAQSSLPYFEGIETPRLRTYTYDPLGRILETVNPDDKKLLACYNDGVSVGIDQDGRRKRTVKDSLGRVVTVNEYDDMYSACTTDLSSPYATTQYQYDVTDNLRFVTDAEGNTTEMRYDSLGRKIYMNDPDMGVWNYTYEANGNLKTQTDAKNQTITFSYDELNRIISKDYPAGTDVSYTYDSAPVAGATTWPIGRLSTTTDASGTTKYYYDKLGRTTKSVKTVNGTDYDFTKSYDALDRITSITYPVPDSETVSYTYDAGLLSQVSGGSVNYASYVDYNALGQPGTITYGNDVNTEYTYHQSNNRLQSIITWNAYEALMARTYDYYDGGNIRDIVDYISEERSQSFWYDGLNRLRQAQSASYGVLWYSYTPTGNMSFKEGINYDYTGPKPHAVKSTSDGKIYQYDENGNMIHECSAGTTDCENECLAGTSACFRNIAYDYDNMPKSIAINGAATSFVYDSSGSRVKKTTSAGDNIYLGKLYECKAGTCTKYIFAGDTRIAMKTNTDINYYHQDHLGSTMVVTNSLGTADMPCSNQPVRIAGATPQYFTTLGEAYDAASDGDVIQARAVSFFETLDLNRSISVTLSGGYDCGYNSSLEHTQLVGMLTDSAGTVTLENFSIVITGTAETKVEDVQYLPFGETRTDAGYLSVNHKFTSQELDAETGLYYYGARYYNQVLGRFISPDTIVPDYMNPQSLNRYSYVLNNPLYYKDPTGHYYDMGDVSFPDYDFGCDFGCDFGGFDWGSGGGFSSWFSSSYGGGLSGIGNSYANMESMYSTNLPIADIAYTYGVQFNFKLNGVIGFDFNFGRDEFWLFSENQVTQYFGVTFLGRYGVIGGGLGRSAYGTSAAPQVDEMGYIIPGSQTTYWNVLSGAEWKPEGQFFEYGNMTAKYNGDFVVDFSAGLVFGVSAYVNFSEMKRRFATPNSYQSSFVWMPNPMPQGTMDCHAPMRVIVP